MAENLKVKEEVIHELVTHSWVQIPDFLPHDFAEEILKYLLTLESHKSLRPAGIGSSNVQMNSSIRGDHIYWLDESKDSAFENELLTNLEELKNCLKQELRMSLKKTEAHFAAYPSGYGYDTHFDRLNNNNSREITFIFYLNKDWSRLDGGELVLYSPNDAKLEIATVSPSFNTLVLFNSRLFPHKVNSSSKIRRSLTGWFKSE